MADDCTTQPLQALPHAKAPAPSRRRLVVLAIVAIEATALGFGAYRYLQYYRLRFLRDAEARLSIDDRPGAIEALRSHILANPNDYATQLRLAELYTAVGQADSASRIYVRVQVTFRSHLSQITDTDESIWARALNAQGDLVDTLCSGKQKVADDFADAGQYSKALSVYDDVIRCREESPYFQTWNGADVKSDGERALLELLDAEVGIPRWVAARTLNTAIATQAYVYWKNGDAERGRAVVAEPVPLIDDREDLEAALPADTAQLAKTWPALRRLWLAEFVADEADRPMKTKDDTGAAQAATAFRFARDLQVEASGGVFDDEANRLQYNEAVAEEKTGHYDRAGALIKELSARNPNYAPGDVESLANFIRDDQETQEVQSRLDAAKNEFGKKEWITSATEYKGAGNYLLSRGRPRDDFGVAECWYNMAAAHYNAGSDGAAKAALVELQRSSPKYEPQVVADFLQEVEDRQRIRASVR